MPTVVDTFRGIPADSQTTRSFLAAISDRTSERLRSELESFVLVESPVSERKANQGFGVGTSGRQL